MAPAVRRLFFFALIFGLQPAAGAAAIHDNVAVVDAPDWIAAAVAPAVLVVPPEHAERSTYYHLVDDQVLVEADRSHDYSRIVLRVQSQEGVENNGQISLTFDPSYQTLALHYVRIVRNGRVIDALNADKVQLLQREQELEHLIYDGRLTANLALEDVRVGDVIDYAYTITGANPVFDGKFYGSYQVRWSAPVAKIHVRVLWPPDRPLHVATYNGADAPRIETVGRHRAYIWERTDVPELRLDSDRPSWHWPFAWVQLSEAANWREVVEWGLKYYATPDRTSAPLTAVIDDIARSSADPAERIAAVLTFVQSEVRYLGIAIGPGSHAPRHPDEVLRRRFGDCKDKTMLMVTMLDRMGIDAAPALVNTGYTHTLSSYHPSPYLFDHVIVRVRHAGRSYWLDPTLTRQASWLAAVHQPDYGHALVLAPGTTDLEAMTPQRASDAPLTHVQEVFDLTDPDGQVATYRLETRYTGQEADRFRRGIASRGLEAVQDDYLNFHARTYPGIRVERHMSYQDNPAANVVSVRESYAIDKPWVIDEEAGQKKFDITAFMVTENISAPETRLRSMPLAVPYPVDVLQETKVLLAGEWDIAPESITHESAFVRYSEESAFADGVYRLTHRYQTLTDHVPAEASEAHIELLEDIYQETGFYLHTPLDEPNTDVATAEATGAGAAADAQFDPWAVLVLAAGVLVGLAAVVYAFVWGVKADAAWRDEALYFPISPVKFVLLSLVTFNVYSIFYFYKNWRYVKARDRSHVMPFWRAFFGVLWFYPLMDNVRKHADGRHLLPGWLAILLALGFLLLPAMDTLNAWVASISGWWGTAGLFGGLLVLPLVLAVNRLEGQSARALAQNSRLRPLNYVGLVALGPVFAFALAGSTNFIPSGSVVPGDRLWQKDIDFMVSEGVLRSGEMPVLYYSTSSLTYRDDGNLMTGSRVISYWRDDDDTLSIQSARFEEVADVSAEYAKSSGDHTQLKVTRADDSWFLVFLSNDGGGDRRFVRLLKERIAAVRASGTQAAAQ